MFAMIFRPFLTTGSAFVPCRISVIFNSRHMFLLSYMKADMNHIHSCIPKPSAVSGMEYVGDEHKCVK